METSLKLFPQELLQLFDSPLFSIVLFAKVVDAVERKTFEREREREEVVAWCLSK